MGLRELKKERTRRTIQEVALRLIKTDGYDSTSVEQIAAAAEVSPATFYRYYRDKEDVVLAMDSRQVLDAAVKANPSNSPFTSFVQTIFGAIADQHVERRDFLLTRYRLIHSVPNLAARLARQRQTYLHSTFEEFVDHYGLSRDDYELRIMFAAVGAIASDTIDYWADRKGRPDIRALLDRAFQQIGPLLQQTDKHVASATAHRSTRRVKRPL